ncbi:MAG TPA: TonB family protein [Flavobacteriales bacterium]|nr:TonB family protein [Flavobacteriales bacterium]HIN40038.1 TonB family protein [Flavobacteriales bacterium]
MVNKQHIDIFSDTECLSLDVMKAYIAHKLGAHERLQVEKHLVDCAICSDAVEGFALMSTGSAINKRVDKINSRIDALTTKAYAPLWKKEYLSYAAAVVGILLVCSTLYVSIRSFFISDNLISQETNMIKPDLPMKEEHNITLDKSFKEQTEIAEKPTAKKDGAIIEDLEIATIPKITDVVPEKETKALALPSEPQSTQTANIPDAMNIVSEEKEEEAEIIIAQSLDQIPAGSFSGSKFQQMESSGSKTSGNNSKAKRNQAISKAASIDNDMESDMVFANDETSIIMEEAEDEEIYSVVEVPPSYTGGEEKLMEYLATNISYPNKAKKKMIEGIVFISFIVNKDGGISDVKILKSLESSCDKEAIRVVKNMPNWIPGKMKNKEVSVQHNLPIKFKISESK